MPCSGVFMASSLLEYSFEVPWSWLHQFMAHALGESATRRSGEGHADYQSPPKLLEPTENQACMRRIARRWLKVYEANSRACRQTRYLSISKQSTTVTHGNLFMHGSTTVVPWRSIVQPGDTHPLFMRRRLKLMNLFIP